MGAFRVEGEREVGQVGQQRARDAGRRLLGLVPGVLHARVLGFAGEQQVRQLAEF